MIFCILFTIAPVNALSESNNEIIKSAEQIVNSTIENVNKPDEIKATNNENLISPQNDEITNTSSVTKSAFENAYNLGQGDTCYGIIKLNGAPITDSGTPNVWPIGGWQGGTDVTGYNYVHITNSNPSIATATYRWEDGKLSITFTPGTSSGTTKISVDVDAIYIHESYGPYNIPLTFEYTVTSGDSTQTGTALGKVTRSVTYDLTTDKAVWGKTPTYDGQYGERSSIGVGIINDITLKDYYYTYYYSFYAQEMLGISVGSYDTSIATVEAYEINSQTSEDDVGNTNMKGVGIKVTGLKAGQTQVVITPKFTIPTTSNGQTAYLITRTMPITVYIKVTGEKQTLPANIKLRKKFESITPIEIPTDFYMNYYYGDDLETLQGTLKLKDATKIEDNLYEWEVELPTDIDITFKEYNYQVDKYEHIGIDGNGNVVKKDHTIPNITFRFFENMSGSTRTITNYYNYAAITVPYRVEWHDKAGNTLQETSYRTGTEGETATPTDDDYIINGYIFDETDNRNILSKELKENEENVLKLYFYRPVVNLHLIKSINGNLEDFENLGLDKSATYKFQVTLTNKNTGEKIQGILDSKTGLQINNIPTGTYVVEETDDMYFDPVNIEALNSIEDISFEKVDNDYILTIKESTIEKRILEIKINNKTEYNRTYEDKKEKINLFNYIL